MIPKIIHYCWFGENKKSIFLENCIKSWHEIMPDYKIRCWTDKDLDSIPPIPFLKEAYEARKWAFVADYVRLHALYTDGGIYMDTDVKVFKSFDKWLNYDFFSGIEFHPDIFKKEGQKLNSEFSPKNKDEKIKGLGLISAVMASKPNHPFVKDCLDVYQKMSFASEDGTIKTGDIIIGFIISKVAESYGFVYIDKQQVLKDNMIILSSSVLVGNSMFLDENSYAIHLCNGSWTEKNKYNTFLYNVRNNYPQIYPVFSFIDRCKNKLSRIKL